MARESKAVAVSAEPAIPSVEEVMERFRQLDAQSAELNLRRRAESYVAEQARQAAAAKVRVDDPRDIQRIMDVLPDGARWQAARGDYWAKGPIMLRGKAGLYLNFGGAAVDFGGTAEFAFLPSEREQQQIFNLKVTGIYVPPPPPEPEPEEDEPEPEPEEKPEKVGKRRRKAEKAEEATDA